MGSSFGVHGPETGGGSTGGSFPPSQVRIGVEAGFTQDVGTWTLSGIPSAPVLYNDSSADGDAVSWPVSLEAGTYKLEWPFVQGDSFGVVVLTLNGTTVSTQDLYAPVDVPAAIKTDSVVVGSAGVKTFKATITGHHAASVGYTCVLFWFVFTRTA